MIVFVIFLLLSTTILLRVNGVESVGRLIEYGAY